MTEPKKKSGWWLTTVLILGIVAALGWIGNTYLWRRAATANDALVAHYKEGENFFRGTGPQASDAYHYGGGKYRFVVNDPDKCVFQVELLEEGSSVATIEAEQGGTPKDGTPVILPAPGNFYFQGNTNAPDCQWEATLIPE